jgi:tetratricopeptide (TPR) repeat protein
MEAIPMLRLLAVLCLTLAGASALADEKIFRKEVRQIVGSSQSQDDARTAAIAKAKRDALEEAGSWLHSETLVRNMKLVRDDVVAISSGITRTRVVDEQPFLEGRAVGIRVVAEVGVDTFGLAERVQKYFADRERLAEKRDETAREAKLLAQLAELEKRMAAMQAERQAADARLAASRDRHMAELDKSVAVMPAQTAKPAGAPAPSLAQVAKGGAEGGALAVREQALRRDIQENSRKLAAQEAFRKGESFSAEPGIGYRYTDPRAAITAFSEAIRLDPEYAEAYSRRGRAHTDLKEYPRALEDIDRALAMDPGIKLAYAARAKTRLEMGDNPGAARDASEAIRRLPDLPNGYSIRGGALARLGEYQKAIADYDQAIALGPKFAIAYAGRAGAKFNLGDRRGAREDTTRACELGYQPACERLRNGPPR